MELRPADDSTGKQLSLRISKHTQLAHVQHGTGILAGSKNGVATHHHTTIRKCFLSLWVGSIYSWA